MCPGRDITLAMQEAIPQPGGPPSLAALVKEAEQTSLRLQRRTTASRPMTNRSTPRAKKSIRST